MQREYLSNRLSINLNTTLFAASYKEGIYAINISTEKLTDGEAIALGAIEIVSIPHISIIDGRENAITEIVEKYRDEMSSMLGEVYQAYKSMSYADGYSKDISLELLWTTQPAI